MFTQTRPVQFRGLELVVDPRVMTPRKESTGLIDHVLTWGAKRANWGVAVDVGTGSGALALALAFEGRFSRVIATDLSADAIAVATLNRDRLKPSVPVEFLSGSLLEPLAGMRVSVIVSNPPYLTSGDIAGLDASVRESEPVQLALDGGLEGLGLTWSLLLHAHHHLEPDGLLALQVDRRRVSRALTLARNAGWENVRAVKDVEGVRRYLLATAP
jgi:release factor glutamine methyltransferase